MTVQKTLDQLLEQVNDNLNSLIREKSQIANISFVMLHFLKGALDTGEELSLQDILCSATVGWALASSRGETLSQWGRLLECYRWPGESDVSYRERLYKQPDSMDKLIALIAKLTVMSNDGLKDVVMRSNPLTGKSIIYVMPDSPFMNIDMLAEIRANLVEVLGPDANIEVDFPTPKKIDMVIQLGFARNTEAVVQKAARKATKRLVHNYFAGLKIGDSLLPDNIYELITSNLPQVRDINYLLQADGLELNTLDCHCSYSEILSLNSIEVYNL